MPYKSREKHNARSREFMRKYRKEHPDREKNRLNCWRYNIDAIGIAHLLAQQNGVCAICCRSMNANGRRMHIDHRHEPPPANPRKGRVRGLLCSRCNHILGWLRDDPETFRRAALYLEASPPEYPLPVRPPRTRPGRPNVGR